MASSHNESPSMQTQNDFDLDKVILDFRQSPDRPCVEEPDGVYSLTLFTPTSGAEAISSNKSQHLRWKHHNGMSSDGYHNFLCVVHGSESVKCYPARYRVNAQQPHQFPPASLQLRLSPSNAVEKWYIWNFASEYFVERDNFAHHYTVDDLRRLVDTGKLPSRHVLWKRRRLEAESRPVSEVGGANNVAPTMLNEGVTTQPPVCSHQRLCFQPRQDAQPAQHVSTGSYAVPSTPARGFVSPPPPVNPHQGASFEPRPGSVPISVLRSAPRANKSQLPMPRTASTSPEPRRTTRDGAQGSTGAARNAHRQEQGRAKRGRPVGSKTKRTPRQEAAVGTQIPVPPHFAAPGVNGTYTARSAMTMAQVQQAGTSSMVLQPSQPALLQQQPHQAPQPPPMQMNLFGLGKNGQGTDIPVPHVPMLLIDPQLEKLDSAAVQAAQAMPMAPFTFGENDQDIDRLPPHAPILPPADLPFPYFDPADLQVAQPTVFGAVSSTLPSGDAPIVAHGTATTVDNGAIASEKDLSQGMDDLYPGDSNSEDFLMNDPSAAAQDGYNDDWWLGNWDPSDISLGQGNTTLTL